MGGNEQSLRGQRIIDQYTKLFDEKTATMNQYDGASGGPAWLRWTRLYMIGNCEHCESMMKWAEAQGTRPISRAEYANITFDDGTTADVIYGADEDRTDSVRAP